ncbi:MAG TPA: response regulator [Burkholderiales bacterium]|nr:response regulator [Burkholderiales bacterium]
MHAAAEQKEINAILNAVEIGVYGVDAAGRCTFINKAGLEMLGYTIDEVLGNNMHALVHHTYPDGTPYPESACPLLQTLETGRPIQLDNEMLWRKDGSFFNAEYSSFPVFDKEVVTGSVITFQDTANKGQARKRLGVQISVSRILAGSSDLNTALTQVLGAIGSALGWHVAVFWEVDEKQSVLRNAAAWPGPEGVGEAFLAGIRNMTFARGVGLPGRVWESEAPAHISHVAMDTTFLRRDAAAKAGLRSGFAFPLKTGTQTVGVMEFFSRRWQHFDDDFLESISTLGQQIGQFLRRKRAEEELRESESLKAAILETALDCVISITADSRIFEWNAAAERTFGYTRDEALGQLMPELIIPEEHRARHYAGITRFLATGQGRLLGRRIEIEALRRDGARFPVELSITSTSLRGEPYFTAYVRDITVRKGYERDLAAAKEEAEEANRAKSQFIANMSHELRTPLTAVIGYGEMLEEEAQDRGLDTMLDDLRKINSNARHLLSLINDVLDISKIEAGKMDVHLETFDVATLVRELGATVEALVANKENTLVVECAPDLGTMHSDAVKVRQCLINLVSNAAKFTERGTVRLEVRRGRKDNGETVVFRVADTGIGMTEEQIAKLFQRFSQADASTTRRFGGTGLGLSITKAFSAMLGGDISVESVAGAGTVFELRLPADSGAFRDKVIADGGAETSETPVELSGDNVVLVIDDDPNARALLSRFLIREGFAVRTASDGKTGLELAHALHPRAILLDVMMPHMDGWAVLSALKADDEVADIPVVMETIVQEKGLAISLGAADYLTKPIQWPRLKKVLDRYRSTTPPARALIVDDDGSTRELLQEPLEKEGWSIVEAHDTEAALARMHDCRPSLVLVDVNMSETNGFALIKALRRRDEWQDVPVIALSAQDLSPEECRRLEGRVQQIINTENDAPEMLLSVLRTIPFSTSAHAGKAGDSASKGAHGYDIVG